MTRPQRGAFPDGVKFPMLKKLALTVLAATTCLASTGCSLFGPKYELPEGVPAVPEAWRTDSFAQAELDSLTFWQDPSGSQHRLYASGKGIDTIFVFDAKTGDYIESLGTTGFELGSFGYPNGLATMGDMVLVVERDNARIQVLNAANGQPVRTFGEELLKAPMGIALYESDEDTYEIYVTDNFIIDDKDPTVAARRHKLRVIRYTVYVQENGTLDVRNRGGFGDDAGPGMLLNIESIAVDSENDRVFIADEAEDTVKVYNLKGEFQNQIIGGGLMEGDSEGIAIFEDSDAPGGGYFIATDQQRKATIFHVFSRDGVKHLGTFTGNPAIANTDGIAISSVPFGQFDTAAFYAVHDDQSVAAYSLEQILATVLGE